MSPTRLLLAAALVLTPGAVLAQTPAAAPSASMAAAPMAAMTKPVTVQGDLIDTLKLNGQFNTFIKGVADTNLTGLLKSNGNLTVFVPTDAAFAAMPPADLAKITSDKIAMQKFLMHHIVNAPIPTTKIKGVKGPIPSGAGDQILLDGSDQGGALKVDGATIIQADVKTASGLLQVVDHVLVAGQGAPEPAAAPAAPSAGANVSATAPAKQ
ncbi:fasciclin domain-containing protein [Phenylobacterium sp.]|uniref:fasciclin domain-containing protein n=1 Tax=Phenylobacterium sp. TaxID=1871053 RepID=UPI0025E775E0|nr:fasciclin domain-containing protein [Phenylobacterium sp.]